MRLLGLTLAAAAAAAPLHAAEPTPLLDQLASEVRALHASVRPSLVQVQLLLPAAGKDILSKWEDRLDPDLRQRLSDAMQRLAVQPAGPLQAVVEPTTGPSTPAPERLLAARSIIGIVLDDAGRVLVAHPIGSRLPVGASLRVVDAAGVASPAEVVGADAFTGLSVLRAETPRGVPAALGGGRPQEGELVLVYSSADGGARLLVWSAATREPGVVVRGDGRIAGFNTPGGFLCCEQLRPVIAQLGDTGVVRRAVLGVLVTQQPTASGAALRIEQVHSGSPADRAGLRAGDVIRAVAGHAVGDFPAFAAEVAQANGPTELRVERDGVPHALTVDLAPR